ncbi:MAG: hypothetical protein JWM99_963 [Verrucomicrobiales bacterium]|nr:hypothetical protein [Verrucomicrobiales bacterium]
MNAGIETFCNHLLGALVNGGYQGVILAALVWLGLKLLRRTNAATRHAIAFTTLLIVGGLPMVHFLTINPEQARSTTTHTITALNQPSRLTIPADESSEASSDPGEATVESDSSDFEIRGVLESIRDLQAENRKNESNQSVGSDSGSHQSPENPFGLFSWLNLLSVNAEWFQLYLPKSLGLALTAAWALLAMVRTATLAQQYWLLRQLKNRGTTPNQELKNTFDRIWKSTGMKHIPAVIICSEPAIPMVAGFWHPTILLPADLVKSATPEQLAHILRHELAHVARQDHWANLIQQSINAVFFFHPSVWWLSKRLTTEREIACDDHVLSVTPARREYALFLTEFARLTQSREWVAAPAAWSKKSQLTERITMILDSKRNTSPRLARAKAGLLTIAATLVAIWGLRAAPRVALAAETSEDKAPKIEAAQETQSVSVASSDLVAPSAADNATESTSTITINSGPRPKPSPHPAPMIAVNTIPATPAALAAPVAVETRVETKRSKRKEKIDDSMEQRLDRLERMVETLMAREKVKKDQNNKEFSYNFKNDDKWKAGAPGQEDMTRIQDLAKRQAEIASKEAQRAVREMERARKDREHIQDEKLMAEMHESLTPLQNMHRDFDQQRQQLEAARKALEKQMHALEKQIDRLNNEQEKVNHHNEENERRIERKNRNSDDSKHDDEPGEHGPRLKPSPESAPANR